MTEEETRLTAEQLERIERNRQRALLLRASSTKAYEAKNKSNTVAPVRKQQVDSGAGFFVDDDPTAVDNRPVTYETVHIAHRNIPAATSDELEVPGVPCDECQTIFLTSYLHKHFDEPICDTCREKFSNENFDDSDDTDEQTMRYGLIARTAAKEAYILSDYDLDKREPLLKCIEKKNPHNRHRGMMRLYLRCQIQRLSDRVHEGRTTEKVAERDERKCEKKRKKYEKQVEQLRLDVRSSLATKRMKIIHEHKYDENNIEFDSDTDTYTKTCLECGHQYQYEEM